MEIPEMVEIRNELKSIRDMFVYIALAGKTVVDINDIARLEGSSYSAISHGKDLYLLPRFGQSAYPTGKKRWPIEEYVEWCAIPADQRRDMYREHIRNGVQMYLNEKRKTNSIFGIW